MTKLHSHLKAIVPLLDASAKVMVYGATGFTAELLLEEIQKYEKEESTTKISEVIILAGRDANKVRSVAQKYGLASCEQRIFKPENAEQNLKSGGIKVVMNCAGPYIKTANPFIDACLKLGISYLDYTGELDVFEYSLSDARKVEVAQKKEVVICSGIGFDVVPTDCLAKMTRDLFVEKYKEQPYKLEMAIKAGLSGSSGMSQGTAKSGLGLAAKMMYCRRDGQLQNANPHTLSKEFEFGGKKTKCGSIPWGDISTAYYSTGIENIQVYFANTSALPVPIAYILQFFLVQWFIAFLFQLPCIVYPIQFLIGMMMNRGPDMKQAGSKGEILAVVRDKKNEKHVELRLVLTANAYKLTADVALLSMLKLALNKSSLFGCVTPSMAFGKDYILKFDGVELKTN